MYQDSVSFVNVPSSADSNRRGLSSLLLLWLPPRANVYLTHQRTCNLTFVVTKRLFANAVETYEIKTFKTSFGSYLLHFFYLK